MGIFRNLGRQVGEFQAKEKAATEEYTVSHCENCGARFSEHHIQCPKCKRKNAISSEQRE
jgi:predicted Zn-ribbon and HTH transcriptional regulator